MTNAEVAKAFYTIAEILSIQGENPFRVRAYERAAQTIESYPQEVSQIFAQGGLKALNSVPGVGEDLALKIQELVNTGRLAYLSHLKKQVPAGVLEILQVEGMGPKRTEYVWKQLGVRSVKQLEEVIKAGKLKGVPVARGIQFRAQGSGRKPIWAVWPTAQAMVDALGKSNLCEQVEVAGSLRRMKDTIGDIDLVASSLKPKLVMQQFAQLPQILKLTASGATKSHAILKTGIECDIRVVKPEQYGAALYYSTGSKKHNVHVRQLGLKRGVTMNEYGVYTGTAAKKKKLVAAQTEEEVFVAMGLPYIPPELREDSGEIEAALAGKLPRLIQLKDIQGDLHVHSDFSDGLASLVEMVRAAKAAGMKYVVCSDHASVMGMVKGVKSGNIGQYLRLIGRARQQVSGIQIVSGLEVDVLADGSLYLSDTLLKKVDWVIASVHSHFKQNSATMTKRLIKAIEHPSVRVLGHPTTRKVARREPIEFDVDRVFKAAKANQVALELDGAPDRLDLPDHLLRRAKDLGVKIVIDTDSHHLNEFNLSFAIGQARRGWLEPKDVLNTLPWTRFKDML